MSTILDRIALDVEKRMNERKCKLGLDSLAKLCKHARQPHPFAVAFSGDGINVIAEVKFASPSEGKLYAAAPDPENVARAYLQNGAQALSILTEVDHFQGNLGYLQKIRAANPAARLLMKDFVIDEYQLFEARHFGADCVLLIVALLGAAKTEALLQRTRQLGLEALVEVHDEEEFRAAHAMGATLIGINNRNLKTMQISIETSFRIARLAQELQCRARLVSESGLGDPVQISELRKVGYSAFLIGSTFMKSQTPGPALAKLLGSIPQ